MRLLVLGHSAAKRRAPSPVAANRMISALFSNPTCLDRLTADPTLIVDRDEAVRAHAVRKPACTTARP